LLWKLALPYTVTPLGFRQQKLAEPILKHWLSCRAGIAVFAKGFATTIACNYVCAGEPLAGDKAIDPLAAQWTGVPAETKRIHPHKCAWFPGFSISALGAGFV